HSLRLRFSDSKRAELKACGSSSGCAAGRSTPFPRNTMAMTTVRCLGRCIVSLPHEDHAPAAAPACCTLAGSVQEFLGGLMPYAGVAGKAVVGNVRSA